MRSMINNPSKNYAVLSKEWVSSIGEELGLQQLPDTLTKQLAQDVSYHLREVLYKCVMRMKHSNKRFLTSFDLNAVITHLCDTDPILGSSSQIPKFLSELDLFIPNENIMDLHSHLKQPFSVSQTSNPVIQELEIVDSKSIVSRSCYAKRALIILLNGSKKSFKVLLHDCSSNAYLGGEGVVDYLMSIARFLVISNNAQYTRVSLRTCQLIIAITHNKESVFSSYLHSVDKLTELLLELLLGQGFINSNLESIFKHCSLNLMLKWPLVANKFIPKLKSIIKNDKYEKKKKLIAFELIAGVDPLIFFKENVDHSLSLENVLMHGKPGTILWHKIALALCAFIKSGKLILNHSIISEHFGDSILPYLMLEERTVDKCYQRNTPAIVHRKIKYKSLQKSKNGTNRQDIFENDLASKPKKQIRFHITGGRSVSPAKLRPVISKQMNQIFRNHSSSFCSNITSSHLLMFKSKTKNFAGAYCLSKTVL
ncbi:hypothetical protein TKK_0005628 [Trichogramma kaykai]|uniref:Transcription initiation factor TFIID subunit 6 n=1 Tax=Trichogramma kaykai TaxID=54128 RepID=A0ABD2XH26_9HYME